MYTYTDDAILSVPAPVSGSTTSDFLWAHTEIFSPGQYYLEVYPFEFEFIFNIERDLTKVFYNFSYTVDVIANEADNQTNITLHNPGFTSFYVYTTHQISDEQDIEYMMNVRRIGNGWKVNKFRDLALLQNSAFNIYTGGMSETINNTFIDLTKSWNKQKKFTDKWVGIRLKANNLTNNLINLYATDVAAKKFYR